MQESLARGVQPHEVLAPDSINREHCNASFVAGGGETGALIRSIAWGESLLGPAEQWPQSLRTSINICVSSRFPSAVYWGPQYVMLYNDDLLPMVGANKHPRAMGRPAFEVLPEIRSIIEPMLERVRSTGEPIWSEDLMLPLLRSDAQAESYFTFTYSPIRDESGAVAGVFCAVLETTDKIIEERRLRLLNALADITGAKTPKDACALAATQLARASNDVPFALFYLVDESTSQLVLAGASNIAPGSVHAPTSVAMGAAAPWPFDVSGAITFRELALEAGPAAARGAVILPIERAGGGRPLGFIVAGLSPLLQSSVSYHRFHNLLAASISQGVSHAAAYDAERQRAESLAKLDRAKTAFFSNVSHELRTPLTLMLAPIQDMLVAASGTPIDHAAVDLLHRNALRLLKLVNTLLEFSRIEAGRFEVMFEPVDLPALTADLASNFRAAVERVGLTLVVDCPPLSAAVHVDRDMWEKIVLNLLSNALKFTFEGTITVRIRAETDDSVVLEVSDTGTGIAERDLPRLFERFHRIEGARSRSHEGSGIGLALIQELVHLHGGRVSVASQPGLGTTFAVHIPRGTAHLSPERVRTSRTLSSTAVGAEPFVREVMRWGSQNVERSAEALMPRTTGPRERIVFADDNADMREYVARLLAERWDVETVSDGEQALAAIRANPPDLVLCDVMMPRLDGFALVRALRADDALRAIPIIVLSARAGDDETAKGLGSGANDYIAKPFSARDLLVRVATNLAAARAANEMAERERALRVAGEQARRGAEAAEQSQRAALEFHERFVAVLGHDLRNPIAAVNMAAGLLAQRAAMANDASTTRLATRIGSSMRRMGHMVGQIMDLSRSRVAGGFDVSFAPVELHELLSGVIDELRTANPEATIRLAGESLIGHWDRERLEQVFSNLIGNAIHYRLAQTPITVRTRHDGECARIEVHNEGPAIPEALRSTLFDPFRRGERSGREAKTAGLGLGLYISRQLVLAHGGELAVRSDAEHGTTFSATLPRTTSLTKAESHDTHGPVG